MITPQKSLNLALLRGVVASEPLTRDLPSGGSVVQFDVSTEIDAGEKTLKVSVPVSWVDPPLKALEPLEPGLQVVVAGTVRRRFFRSAGSTQSRTEIVVEAVVPTRRTKQVRTLFADMAERVSVHL